MTDWKLKAKRARSNSKRREYMRRHTAENLKMDWKPAPVIALVESSKEVLDIDLIPFMTIRSDGKADRRIRFSGAWIVIHADSHNVKPGTIRWELGRIHVYTYRPLRATRSKRVLELMQRDINKAASIESGQEWWKPTTMGSVKRHNSKESSDLTALLDGQGWAVINSKRLDDQVVVVKDDLVKVPVKYATRIRYSVEELVRIGELGAGARLTLGELSAIHLVKHLGGTIVYR